MVITLWNPLAQLVLSMGKTAPKFLWLFISHCVWLVKPLLWVFYRPPLPLCMEAKLHFAVLAVL